jgi:hypothetical protein
MTYSCVNTRSTPPPGIISFPLLSFTLQIASIGEDTDLTYKYEHLGTDPAALSNLLAKGSPFLEKLKSANAPAVVVGPGVLRREDRDAVMKAVHDVVDKAGGWGEGGGNRVSCVTSNHCLIQHQTDRQRVLRGRGHLWGILWV